MVGSGKAAAGAVAGGTASGAAFVVSGGRAATGAVAGATASVVASGKAVASGVGQLFLVWPALWHLEQRKMRLLPLLSL